MMGSVSVQIGPLDEEERKNLGQCLGGGTAENFKKKGVEIRSRGSRGASLFFVGG